MKNGAVSMKKSGTALVLCGHEVERQLLLVVALGEKDFLCGVKPAGVQLLLKPCGIEPHAMEVVVKDAAV